MTDIKAEASKDNKVKKKLFGFGNTLFSGGNSLKNKISSIFIKKQLQHNDFDEDPLSQTVPNMPIKSPPKKLPSLSKAPVVVVSQDEKDKVYDVNDEDDDEEEEEEEDESDPAQENEKEAESIKINENHDGLYNIKKKNSKSKNTKDNESEFNMNCICHHLYKKGMYISLHEVKKNYKFNKVKYHTNKSLFNKFGFLNKNNSSTFSVIPYRTFIHENFIYFMKDIKVPGKDPSIRKIGNKYNILNVYNYTIADAEEGKKKMKFDFTSDDKGDHFYKECIFENAEFEKYESALCKKLEKYGIVCSKCESHYRLDTFTPSSNNKLDV